MSGIVTKEFWIATGERVLTTFLQALLGLLTADTAMSGAVDLSTAPWKLILIASGSAAGYSLIKCLIAGLATKDGPSLTHAETLELK